MTESTLGQFLTQQGISASELAHESGVSESTISRICTGKTNFKIMSHGSALRLARAIGYNVPGVTTKEMINERAEEVKEIVSYVIKNANPEEVSEIRRGELHFFPICKLAAEIKLSPDYAQAKALDIVLPIWARWNHDSAQSFGEALGKAENAEAHDGFNLAERKAKIAFQNFSEWNFSDMSSLVATMVKYTGFNYAEWAEDIYRFIMGDTQIPYKWAREAALVTMRNSVAD